MLGQRLELRGESRNMFGPSCSNCAGLHPNYSLDIPEKASTCRFDTSRQNVYMAFIWCFVVISSNMATHDSLIFKRERPGIIPILLSHQYTLRIRFIPFVLLHTIENSSVSPSTNRPGWKVHRSFLISISRLIFLFELSDHSYHSLNRSSPTDRCVRIISISNHEQICMQYSAEQHSTAQSNRRLLLRAPPPWRVVG